MKRILRHRPLAFEQLESKAAPSSILLVLSAGSPDPGFAEVANTCVAAHSLRFSDCRYDTEQILRFISENTSGGERSHRPAALPTAAACMASDEMMRQVAIESHSLCVVGFYEDATEL